MKNWNCWVTVGTEFCGCSLIHIWIAGWISIEWMGPLDENVNCFLWLDVWLCIVLRKAFLFITSCYHLLSSTCIWRNLPFLSHRSEEFQSSNYFDEFKLLLLRSGLRCFPAESQTHFQPPYNGIFTDWVSAAWHWGTEEGWPTNCKSLKPRPLLATIFITFGTG